MILAPSEQRKEASFSSICKIYAPLFPRYIVVTRMNEAGGGQVTVVASNEGIKIKERKKKERKVSQRDGLSTYAA